MRTARCCRAEVSKWIGMGLLSLCLGLPALAVDPDELAETIGPVFAPGPAAVVGGVPPLDGLLFVGTSTNVNDPTATVNDIFSVDPVANTSASILTATQVWGATADPDNERILFTVASGLTPPAGQIGGGDELMSVPYGGGTPTSLGRITTAAGGFRVDGLAISGGVIYAVNAGAGADNGFYTIDPITLEATVVALFADSIGGLDADPDTGIIYGTNDTTFQLVTISPTGTITNVAAYPVGLTDIDGLAVGVGFAFLVTDESGTFPVYDLGLNAYGTPLTSPFTAADTFSGAAIAVPGGEIFTDGFESGNTSMWSSTVP